MFVNVVEIIESASPALEHVHLSQGTRWYGNHLGPFKTPAKEDDPRHMPPNFYFDQQEFLEQRQKGKRWTWSVGRPHAVCGFSTGNPMNLTLAIAVYANISKALGLPLSFPGKPGHLRRCINARTRPCWRRRLNGWRPSRRLRTKRSTLLTAIYSAGSTCGPSLPISLTWTWHSHATSASQTRWPTRGQCGIASWPRMD